jgi:CMP-N,N'-diacetyllegionaminic acid synthase
MDARPRKTIALIPARGGSKGLPGKNIRPLLGKPMLAYSIEAAQRCSLVDAVYVSTDAPAIARVAEEWGAIPVPRPPELATDTASSLDVVRHFLSWHRKTQDENPETLVLLQPTSPLRTAQHLTEALLLYRESGNNTVVSVTSTKPLAWQGSVHPETGVFQTHQHLTSSSNRQSEAANYVLNGAIYIAPPARYEQDTLLSGPVRAYVMPPEAAVDIDTLHDFEIAECLTAKRQEGAADHTQIELEPA